jgi:eukaryotic-like serine/threonine-protein kinase
MSSREPEIGLIVARYKLDRVLGEGGMGSVWAATHTVTRKPAALKFIKQSVASDPSMLRRFMREARAASAVRHPNVVQIHDILEVEEGVPVMVMDLLEGESLGEKLEREGRIELPELAQILRPVISAVGTAHAAGIVHRDLKPDNIFLARLGDGSVVPKVLDFGIAKLSAVHGAAEKTADLTTTGTMLGTPCYMAPEQAFGEKDVDHLADVWAMGIIIYECLAGRRPVDGSNFGQVLKVIMTGAIVPLAEVAPELPADVTHLVTRMLTSDRARRSQDLLEAFEVLGRHADDSVPSVAFARPAPRLIASPSEGGAGGTDPFAQTELASSATIRRSRASIRWGLSAGIGAALASLAVGATYLARREPVAVPSSPAPGSIVAAVDVAVIPPADSIPSPQVVAAPAASAAQTATAAPKSSAAPAPASATAANKGRPGRKEAGDPSPRPPPTAGAAPSAAPDATRIHGVVVKAPF